MTAPGKLKLHQYDYDEIVSHIHSLEERSAIAAKWANWTAAAKDMVSNYIKISYGGKLSDLSTNIKTRLSDWAIIPKCSYMRATKTLYVRLTFLTDNVAAPGHVYTDDAAALRHLELQLAPAFDILSRYLKATESVPRDVRILEKEESIRTGMPLAVSVFLTYAPFDF